MSKEQQILTWLNNTQDDHNWREAGILQFARHFFPHIFYNDFAYIHFRVLKEMLALYDPAAKDRMDRRRYIVIHREAAKTTLVTKLWPLVCIWLKGFPLVVRYGNDIVTLPPLTESLILVASETAKRSENFVMDIKNEVDTNRALRDFFGEKNPQYVQMEEDEDRKNDTVWRQNAFITSDGTAIWGLGAGQQTRGIQIRNRRPTLAIVDDMYSKKNIKTDTMRETMNYWFEAEFQNTVDTLQGKSLFAGTILHPDTVAARLSSMSSWEGVNIPIIHYDELKPILDNHCRWQGDTFKIPDATECAELQKNITTLSWPERYTLHYVLKLYADCAEQHKLGYFYQEYLNMTVAPEEQRFQWEDFRAIKPTYGVYLGQPFMSFEYKGETWYTAPKFHLGADFASSESETADETVLVVGAMIRCISRVDEHGRSKQMVVPYIAHIEGGRGWGVYADNDRPGIVTNIKKLCQRYTIANVTADANATQELIVRETERHVRDLAHRPTVYHHKGAGKKTDFILSVLEPVFQQHEVCLYNETIRPLVRKTFDQLITMNGKGHDDYPDALAMLFYNCTMNQLLPLMSDVSVPSPIKATLPKLSSRERWETL